MKTDLKSKLETAINKVLDENADNNYWKEWIHDGLVRQMTDAAEIVFDASQDAQVFAKKQ